MDIANILEGEFEGVEDYRLLEVGQEASTGDDDDSEQLGSTDVVECDLREEDIEEDSVLSRFLESTCGCKLGMNKVACSSTLSSVECIEFRNNCYQLSHDELDLVILSQIQSHYFMGDSTPVSAISPVSASPASQRSTNSVSKFFFREKPLCRKMFLFLHTVQHIIPLVVLLFVKTLILKKSVSSCYGVAVIWREWIKCHMKSNHRS